MAKWGCQTRFQLESLHNGLSYQLAEEIAAHRKVSHFGELGSGTLPAGSRLQVASNKLWVTPSAAKQNEKIQTKGSDGSLIHPCSLQLRRFWIEVFECKRRTLFLVQSFDCKMNFFYISKVLQNLLKSHWKLLKVTASYRKLFKFYANAFA